MRTIKVYEGLVKDNDDEYPREKIGNDECPDILYEYKNEKIRLTIEVLEK